MTIKEVGKFIKSVEGKKIKATFWSKFKRYRELEYFIPNGVRREVPYTFTMEGIAYYKTGHKIPSDFYILKGFEKDRYDDFWNFIPPTV